LRLLYVALTRARDRLILVLEKDQPAPWLDSLQASWLRPGGDRVLLPDSATPVVSLTLELTPPADIPGSQADPAYAWFPDRLDPASREPARLTPSGQPEAPGSLVGRVIDLGVRLPFSGRPDEADLGDALHAILAAEFLSPGHPNRREMSERILAGYGLSDHLKSDDAIAVADRLRCQLEAHFHPSRFAVEVPIEAANDRGQRIEGFIDLLLETPEGWVVIDHKSFPGKHAEWPARALSYSGQLALYREALGKVGVRVASLWIHFSVGGGLVEVLPPGGG
jgi:ATP-dependent exoDNAse (exonuclease V) beta subunit